MRLYFLLDSNISFFTVDKNFSFSVIISFFSSLANFNSEIKKEYSQFLEDIDEIKKSGKIDDYKKRFINTSKFNLINNWMERLVYYLKILDIFDHSNRIRPSSLIGYQLTQYFDFPLDSALEIKSESGYKSLKISELITGKNEAQHIPYNKLSPLFKTYINIDKKNTLLTLKSHIN